MLFENTLIDREFNVFLFIYFLFAVMSKMVCGRVWISVSSDLRCRSWMKVKMFRHMGESGKDYERKIDVARKCREGIKHVWEGTDKRYVCMVFKN